MLLLASGLVWADPTPPLRLPALGDFQFRQPLDVGAAAPAYHFALPAEMYLEMGNPDWQHMAIFNARGEPLPWRHDQLIDGAVTDPAAAPATASTTEGAELASATWFPATVSKGDAVGSYRVKLPQVHFVRALRITYPADNRSSTVRIFAARGSGWQPLQQETLSQLRSRGGVIKLNNSPAVNQFRLDFVAPLPGFFASPPQVEYAVHAKGMSFVGDGNGPYTLAYGVAPELASAIDWRSWQFHPNYPMASSWSNAVSLLPVQIYVPLLQRWLPPRQATLLSIGAGVVLILLALVGGLGWRWYRDNR